ncbi:MAG: DNA-3-methyladenine glycosylase [bacterium]|nr:DNA-3-methyladenine glycosylase [bacterium]
MKARVLSQKFFNRPTLVVAKDLLGKYLVRRLNGKIGRFMITEVEAYDGFKDKASHASRGMTKRNAPMFGEAGRWYVYFTYGMHYMLNIVTGMNGYPAAVLIRGVEGVNGPGRVTKQLKIDKIFNNKLAIPKNKLWLENNSIFENSRLRQGFGGQVKFKIKSLPRIGIAYAGPIWSKKLWRFKVDINV